MDLDFALLADGVSPRPDGKLDIYGAGFDTITAPEVPARHERIILIIRLLISAYEAEHPHRVDVVLQAADGARIAQAQANVEPASESRRSQLAAGRQIGVGLLLGFENVVFPERGTYQFVIHWDGNECRAPLRLFVVEPPQPAT